MDITRTPNDVMIATQWRNRRSKILTHGEPTRNRNKYTQPWKLRAWKFFLFLFQAMKGNFLTFACWKVIKNGRSSLLGMEIAAVIKGNRINKRCFHLQTLKWMCFYLLPFDASDLYWCVISMDKISLKLPSFA